MALGSTRELHAPSPPLAAHALLSICTVHVHVKLVHFLGGFLFPTTNHNLVFALELAEAPILAVDLHLPAGAQQSLGQRSKNNTNYSDTRSVRDATFQCMCIALTSSLFHWLALFRKDSFTPDFWAEQIEGLLQCAEI